ncbi:hypothetical protein AB0F93_00435 [Micromonospora tulbaghiae]|uniref:hypothetical protein n=1 Tax=Micromonospora tulbaghiae TaxID=479978 RepID=UPI0033318B9C
MAGIKDRWNRLCDAAEDIGAQDQGKEQPAPLAELVQRLRMPAERLGLAEQVNELAETPVYDMDGIDAMLAQQLMQAYEKGRSSGRIDMDEVARHIREAGVSAFVGYDGGGVTISAGERWEWPDGSGDQRYAVLIGPGSFTDPKLQRPFSNAGDFYIGPDDDGEGLVTTVADGTPPEQVARMAVDMVRRVEKQRKRIEAAVEAAGDAFWAAIAAAFPEATAGDYPPDAVMNFKRTQHQAVALWLEYNAPQDGIAPDAPPAPKPRYGLVRWETHDEKSRGVWRFRLAESVTDFAEAWDGAVEDFCNDREVFTRAVEASEVLFHETLLNDYPEILAKRGLTFLPDPVLDPVVAEATAYVDDILVDEDSGDRCRVLDVSPALRCGAPLDDDGQCSRDPMAHHREIDE